MGTLHLGALTMALALASCTHMSIQDPSSQSSPATSKSLPEGADTLVVAGGCFWCVEAVFDELKGVYWSESGYTGGQSANPTYRDICSGTTGHAEAVKIVFDPKVVSKADLLRVFFVTHDPTTKDRQGPDTGTQYRSAVFYSSEEEKALAESVIAEISAESIYDAPIVTTLEPLRKFYVAEDYHQDYFDKYENASPAERMSMNAGYCSAVISPKVSKFRKMYADRLKK